MKEEREEGRNEGDKGKTNERGRKKGRKGDKGTTMKEGRKKERKTGRNMEEGRTGKTTTRGGPD